MAKNSWLDRMYVWVEGLLIRVVPQHSVGPLMKWVFKFPIPLFKLGLARMFEPYILVLTTTGRKTGKPRLTPVEYEYEPQQNRYYVMAGWAGNTDWYRNLRSEPNVQVQVGNRKFPAVAVPATDEETAEKMMELARTRPSLRAVFQRWSDRPLEETFESYVYAARFFPSVWLKPILGWM